MEGFNSIKFVGFTFIILSLVIMINSLFQRKNDTPRIFYKKSLPFGFNGFVIPSVGVFIKEEHKDSEALLLHELVHWKQYQREGLFRFLFNYNLATLKHGYDGNPYEIEARFEESDFCKSNYTYCVRNGLAKTVCNPNFRNGRA